MNGSNLKHWWINLVGSIATIALILTAFGLMLGIVNPSVALKRIGTTLGALIALVLAPCILVSAWLEMTLWERIGLVVIGVCVWQGLRPRRQIRNK
jgi:hypothetical protein